MKVNGVLQIPEIPKQLIINTLANGKSSRRNFTKEEDERLITLVKCYGKKNWETISKLMPFRNARQCKDRYNNYLSPEINLKPWTKEEDLLLIEKFNELGQKWVQISQFFNGRSDNNVKNRWYNHLRQIVDVSNKNNNENEIELFNDVDQFIMNDFTDFDDLCFDRVIML